MEVPEQKRRSRQKRDKHMRFTIEEKYKKPIAVKTGATYADILNFCYLGWEYGRERWGSKRS